MVWWWWAMSPVLNVDWPNWVALQSWLTRVLVMSKACLFVIPLLLPTAVSEIVNFGMILTNKTSRCSVRVLPSRIPVSWIAVFLQNWPGLITGYDERTRWTLRRIERKLLRTHAEKRHEQGREDHQVWKHSLRLYRWSAWTMVRKMVEDFLSAHLFV